MLEYQSSVIVVVVVVVVFVVGRWMRRVIGSRCPRGTKMPCGVATCHVEEYYLGGEPRSLGSMLMNVCASTGLT
jgi:hypothetical protein